MLFRPAPCRTPLFLAAVSGSTGVLDLLIKAGAQASVHGTAAWDDVAGGCVQCTNCLPKTRSNDLFHPSDHLPTG